MKTRNLIFKCRLCGALVYIRVHRALNDELIDEITDRNSAWGWTMHSCANGHTGICDLSGYKEGKG